eukprot:2171435-Rhodomonas_salina.2
MPLISQRLPSGEWQFCATLNAMPLQCQVWPVPTRPLRRVRYDATVPSYAMEHVVLTPDMGVPDHGDRGTGVRAEALPPRHRVQYRGKRPMSTGLRMP